MHKLVRFDITGCLLTLRINLGVISPYMAHLLSENVRQGQFLPASNERDACRGPIVARVTKYLHCFARVLVSLSVVPDLVEDSSGLKSTFGSLQIFFAEVMRVDMETLLEVL